MGGRAGERCPVGRRPGDGRPAPVEPMDGTESAARVAKAQNALHGYATDDEGGVYDTTMEED